MCYYGVDMKDLVNILMVTVVVVSFICLILYVVTAAVTFYTGTCQQVKEYPVPMYTPNRCINVES